MVARQNFQLPDVIDPPRRCLQINIPDNEVHILALVGAIKLLTDWFNWERDPDKLGTQVAKVWEEVFLSIDWSIMSCCPETEPILRRVDPDNPYLIQISVDGGMTWEVDPGNPSITATQLPLPTMDAHHTKCDAASNALQHLKDLEAKQVDENSSGATIITVAVDIAIFIAALLLVVFTEGGALPIVTPVLVSIVGAVLALSGTAFADYFTSDVWDKVLCALYDNISADGTFSDSGWTAVTSQLAIKLPAGTPQADWLIQILKVMGSRGLTTLAGYGNSADADCSTCSSCEFTGWTDIFGGTPPTPEPGVIEIVATNGHGDIYYYAGIEAPSDSADCRKMTAHEISGHIDYLRLWSECGEGVSTTHLSGSIDPGTECYRTIVFQSTVPFTVRLTCAEDC
jgi:hypothetical protein